MSPRCPLLALAAVLVIGSASLPADRQLWEWGRPAELAWKRVEGAQRLSAGGSDFYAVGPEGEVRRSQDLGKTWAAVHFEPRLGRDLENEFMAPEFFEGEDASYAWHRLIGLYRAERGASRFRLLDVPSCHAIYSPTAVGRTLYVSVCGVQGEVLTSRDGGRTWASAAFPRELAPPKLTTDGATLIALSHPNHVLRLDARAARWVKIELPPQVERVRQLLIDGRTLYLVDFEQRGPLYDSDNWGATWLRLYDPHRRMARHFLAARGLLFLAGRGVAQVDADSAEPALFLGLRDKTIRKLDFHDGVLFALTPKDGWLAAAVAER